MTYRIGIIGFDFEEATKSRPMHKSSPSCAVSTRTLDVFIRAYTKKRTGSE